MTAGEASVTSSLRLVGPHDVSRQSGDVDSAEVGANDCLLTHAEAASRIVDQFGHDVLRGGRRQFEALPAAFTSEPFHHPLELGALAQLNPSEPHQTPRAVHRSRGRRLAAPLRAAAVVRTIADTRAEALGPRHGPG